MPKIKYQEFNFRPATLVMIAKANEIIAEYQQAEHRQTLALVAEKFTDVEEFVRQ